MWERDTKGEEVNRAIKQAGGERKARGKNGGGRKNSRDETGEIGTHPRRGRRRRRRGNLQKQRLPRGLQLRMHLSERGPWRLRGWLRFLPVCRNHLPAYVCARVYYIHPVRLSCLFFFFFFSSSRPRSITLRGQTFSDRLREKWPHFPMEEIRRRSKGFPSWWSFRGCENVWN